LRGVFTGTPHPNLLYPAHVIRYDLHVGHAHETGKELPGAIRLPTILAGALALNRERHDFLLLGFDSALGRGSVLEGSLRATVPRNPW
jgi:hypothetical protein